MLNLHHHDSKHCQVIRFIFIVVIFLSESGDGVLQNGHFCSSMSRKETAKRPPMADITLPQHGLYSLPECSDGKGYHADIGQSFSRGGCLKRTSSEKLLSQTSLSASISRCTVFGFASFPLFVAKFLLWQFNTTCSTDLHISSNRQ